MPVYFSLQGFFCITNRKWYCSLCGFIYNVSVSSQKFTSLETLLCPPEGDKNETVDFSLSTRGADNKGLQIALHNVSFILQWVASYNFFKGAVSGHNLYHVKPLIWTVSFLWVFNLTCTLRPWVIKISIFLAVCLSIYQFVTVSNPSGKTSTSPSRWAPCLRGTSVTCGLPRRSLSLSPLRVTKIQTHTFVHSWSFRMPRWADLCCGL